MNFAFRAPVDRIGAPQMARGRPPLVAFALLMALALVPLGLADPLPLVDLPAHLARAYIHANIDTSAVLDKYYAVDWQFLSNLGVDIFLPPLLKVMSPHAATVLLAALLLVATATAVIAIHRTLFGRWSAFPLLAFLLLYNKPFLWGFINYVMAIALALWLFFAWLKLRHLAWWVRVPLFAALTTLLAPIHLYGFAFYAVLIGTSEFSRVAFGPRAQWGRGAVTLALNALPFAPGIALVFSSPTTAAAEPDWGSVLGKLHGLLEAVQAYGEVSAAVLLVFLGLVVGAGLLTGRVVIHRTMVLAIAVLVLVYFAMPLRIFGSGYADVRLLPVIGLVFAATADWRVPSLAWRRGWIALFAAILVLRMASVMVHFVIADRYFAEVRQSLAPLQPGDRLAVAVLYRPGDFPSFPPNLHLAEMAVVEHEAFVNSMFHDPGAQPLTIVYDVDPAFRGCCSHEIEVPPDGPAPNPFATIPLAKFDYLIVFGTALLEAPPPASVELAFEGDGFALYRVRDPLPKP